MYRVRSPMTTYYVALVVTQNANGEMNIKPLAGSHDKAKVEARAAEFEKFASENQACDLFEVEDI